MRNCLLLAVATVLWPFFSASAPTNGMAIYDVSPWVHDYPNTFIGPDTATGSMTADHSFELTEVPGRTELFAAALRRTGAITGLALTPSDLVGACGRIAASAVDIRVLKFWYQHSTSPNDIGIDVTPSTDRYNQALVPELLLKNDALFDIDEVAEDNDVLIAGGPSTVNLNPEETNTGRVEVSTSTLDFEDAATLQAFDTETNRNKVVVVAITVPTNAGGCLHTGTIDMDDGTTNYGTIEISLTVRDVSIGAYGRHIGYYRAGTIDDVSTPVIGSETRSTTQLRAELAEFARARMLPIVYASVANTAAYMDELVTAGLGGGPFYSVGLLGSSYANSGAGETAYAADCTSVKASADARGFTETWSYVFDEPNATQLSDHLARAAACQATGVKTFIAGGEAANSLDAQLGSPEEIDLLIDEEHPLEASEANWNTNSREILSYANRQSQIEDPYTVRRNYAWAVWAQGFDGFGIYAFQDSAGEIYNDYDDSGTDLRDGVICYPTKTGCIRTIQLEAYREAVDDYHMLRELEARIALYDNGADTQLDAAADAAQTYLNTVEADFEDADVDAGGKTDTPTNLNFDMVAARLTVLDHLERLNPKNTQEYR